MKQNFVVEPFNLKKKAWADEIGNLMAKKGNKIIFWGGLKKTR